MGARPTAFAASCFLLSSLFVTGQAEGFALSGAKEGSRFAAPSAASTPPPPPSRSEAYQPDFRGIKAAMQATNAEGQAALAKQYHQHSLHDHNHQPPPDFERQLEQLKGSEDPARDGRLVAGLRGEQGGAEEEPPSEPPIEVAPISRKDDLFTPGLGVEEVSFLRPPARGTETTDEPPTAQLLASEADVLEELQKLSRLHDGAGGEPEDGGHHRGGGGDPEEEEGEEEVGEGGEGSTPGPGSAPLEERLSSSLRELAALRRRQSRDELAGPPPGLPPPSARGAAQGGPPYSEERDEESSSTRAAMKKAHMARKLFCFFLRLSQLMDPEDPKRDEDLLELMLRIAENPDEWKRVHDLLRQLDDDLTTYERTMQRVQALATVRSAQEASGAEEREEKAARREEMSRWGLPAGAHGEATSTTPQPSRPPPDGHGDEWRPKFAYHRVTSAPLLPDLFLQQHQQQQQHHHEGAAPGHPPHHRNAYIAVSIIAPPARGSKTPPRPPPPPTRRPVPMTPPEAAVAEETLREPEVGVDEEEVDAAARQATSLHQRMVHADPVEEQLRALAAVEQKLRHHLHEKDRMRHLLKDAGEEGGTEPGRKSKRNTLAGNGHRHHQDGHHTVLKNS
ncbi:uncharacterized protein [Hetaerina americana]|uniref:uncharacterized protein isoform X2 n=1 Tax=Hetaerina americana TaxID=62018 RepID=UPI003A7F3A74